MIATFLVLTVVAFLAPQILPGVKVKGIGTAALIALVFGLLNLLIGWLLKAVVGFLSLPLIVVTFGLFAIVVTTAVNALLLKLTDALIEAFELDGWWPALGMGFLFALGGRLAHALT